MMAVAVLYFGRSVFIPFALAILFSFLLAPLVIRLRHLGLGRTPSALLVVLLAFGLLTIFGFVMVSQLADVGRKLPEYQENIHTKLISIRSSGTGFMTRIDRTIHNVTEDITPRSPAPQTRAASSEDRPVPVEIRKAPFAPMEMAQKIVGSLLEILVTFAVVVVFVIFMLIQREDLRDRLIRLAGAGRVNVTTQALDDAAGRLARYLLAQLVVNVGFGVVAGVGLYFVGVPNPLLWGMIAAVCRYIPYLGIWIAAAFPAILAFAVEPGWLKVPLIFGIYFGIDLIMYNLVEPLLYGSSTGISPMAILVAAVFWTWLWGAVGLLLATPLTVCLVVLGRHVSSLEFLSVLLSDEPVLTPQTRFYQRMLAMDLEEAREIAEEFLKGKSLEELDDQLIVPALELAEADRHLGKLDEKRQQFIFENTRMLLADLSERAEKIIGGDTDSKPEGHGEAELKELLREAEDAEVLCIPARDEADAIGALMLSQLLMKRGIKARTLPGGALAGECLQQVQASPVRVACVVAVPPHGYTQARYLCRRLRSECTTTRLVGAILTEGDVDEIRRRDPALEVDEIASTLKQAMASVISLLHATSQNGSKKPEPTAAQVLSA